MLALVVIAIEAALGTLLLVSVLLSRRKGAHGGHETDMTAVMTAGMVVGLTGGVVAGLLLPEDLWVSTLIGGSSGIAAGAVVGRPGGLMTVLEGAMAGLMGGSMGAMMGGMMPARGAPLLASLVILTAGAGIAAARLVAPKGHHGGSHEPFPPKVMAFGGVALVSVGIAAWALLGPVVHRIPAQRDHHSAWTEVNLRAADFHYSTSEVTLTLGQPVRLRLTNEGEQEHDVTISGLAYTHPNQRDRRAELPGIHLHSPPGQTVVAEFVPQRVGEYEAYCTVPGHKEQGMRMVFRVVGP